jgi:spore coat polysaccharide biosynthesis protein SpsF
MIGHHLDRLQRCGMIDRIILATSVEESDDPIARFCASEGIGCYRGPLHDVLARYEGAAREYDPADHIVRLTGDCPLADPEVIDEIVRRHIADANDYTANVLQQTFPNGLDAEVVTRSALRQAADEATDPYDREHVMPFFYRRPERYKLGNVRSRDNNGHMRWTVDTPADFRMVDAVYRELLSPEKAFGYADIVALLERRPDIAAINARSR